MGWRLARRLVLYAEDPRHTAVRILDHAELEIHLEAAVTETIAPGTTGRKPEGRPDMKCAAGVMVSQQQEFVYGGISP